MKKTLPILLFLIFTGVLVGQLKISQYPNTNALGPNQLFIVTAGGTNMNVKTSDMPGALGVPTLATLYSVGANTTNFAKGITNNNIWVNGSLTIPPGQDLIAQDRFLLSGDFVDANNSSGTAGQVLTSTGSSANWSNAPTSFDTLYVGTLTVTNPIPYWISSNGVRYLVTNVNYVGNTKMTNVNGTMSVDVTPGAASTTTNFDVITMNNGIASNSFQILGTGTNYFSNSVEVVSGQFRGNGGGLTNVGEVLTASNSLYTVSSNVASALAASAAATASNTLYTTSSNIASSLAASAAATASNSLYTTSSNIAQAKADTAMTTGTNYTRAYAQPLVVGTNLATGAGQVIDMSQDSTVCITNAVAGNVIVLLTNIVDRKFFVLRCLADGSARTLAFATGGGTINWIATNNITLATNFGVTANKIGTIVGRAWVAAGVTNIDVFGNVQP